VLTVDAEVTGPRPLDMSETLRYRAGNSPEAPGSMTATTEDSAPQLTQPAGRDHARGLRPGP